MARVSAAAQSEPTGKQVMLQFVYLGLSLIGSGLLMKWATSQLDPTRDSKKKAKVYKRMLCKRLGRNIETNNHEDVIACDAVNPDNIDVRLEDIGGHADTKQVLNAKVIFPLRAPQLFNSYLLRQAKGVLLYGPPGTGKTMLAKALAKEAGACFINIKASTLQNKWFGETQKLVQAVFSLANKLQPCIIFIDEVDALLGRRREQEHEAITTMKTEFMQLWDGFSTEASSSVMVLGATNRPFDLDDAVLRRFALQLEVGMPDAFQREAILGLILRRHDKDSKLRRSGPGISPELLQNEAGRDGRRAQAKIAEQTEGYSGSDLMELCSRAATLTIQECLIAGRTDGSGTASSSDDPLDRLSQLRGLIPGSDKQLRDITLADFIKVLGSHRPSTHQSEAYRSQMAARGRGSQQRQPAIDFSDLPALMQLLTLSQAAANRQ